MKKLVIRLSVTLAVLGTVVGGVSAVDSHAQGSPQATKQYCC